MNLEPTIIAIHTQYHSLLIMTFFLLMMAYDGFAVSRSERLSASRCTQRRIA